MIINFDQTPLKLVPCGNSTLAKKNSGDITINEASDKRSITATFAISVSGKFVPIQLIYGGKTTESLPRYQFREGFSLSVIKKLFSNNKESVIFLNKIIEFYVKKIARIKRSWKGTDGSCDNGCFHRTNDFGRKRASTGKQHIAAVFILRLLKCVTYFKQQMVILAIWINAAPP